MSLKGTTPVEDMAAASGLTTQAQDLVRVVAMFKLDQRR